MAPNHFEGKILNVHPNLAVKINPVFYQLLNGSYEGWFYERFINLVSKVAFRRGEKQFEGLGKVAL